MGPGKQNVRAASTKEKLKVVFFKQKTAYDMLRSLVGSEMCIRDSHYDILAKTRSRTDDGYHIFPPN